ncbi:prepilin-type N-terminal cleavage/methylation domain-containing protein [Parapusillimonas sp. SGNA-6]|nr:prepilin-type N-terminal cleavage/methylation domain-containing protein [Parapusillimonas sp. SGNA-6]
MPISDPGHASRQEGFTLLEMMIVLVIIGIATSMASVSAFSRDGARDLRQDASRLAYLFTAAHAEARASGRTIVWTHDEEGYRFTRMPRRLVLPARLATRAQVATDDAPGTDTVLRQRAWMSSSKVSVRIRPDAGMVFGADWIPGPLYMELEANGQVVRLSRLGSGRYVVEP